jgi:hypothetical protein
MIGDGSGSTWLCIVKNRTSMARRGFRTSRKVPASNPRPAFPSLHFRTNPTLQNFKDHPAAKRNDREKNYLLKHGNKWEKAGLCGKSSLLPTLVPYVIVL